MAGNVTMPARGLRQLLPFALVVLALGRSQVSAMVLLHQYTHHASPHHKRSPAANATVLDELEGNATNRKPSRVPDQGSKLGDTGGRPAEPGCYVKMPSGCRKKGWRKVWLKPNMWTRDTPGEQLNGSGTMLDNCESRRQAYNTWCGVDDAQMYFVEKARNESNAGHVATFVGAQVRGETAAQNNSHGTGTVATPTPVREYFIVKLASDQSSPRLEKGAVHTVTNATLLSMTATEYIRSLAQAPLQIARLGGAVVAMKATIIGKAVARSIKLSLIGVSEGDVAGAVYAPIEAMEHATIENDVINASTTAAAEASFGIILVFAFIGSCWIAEALIVARADAAEDAEKEQHGDAPTAEGAVKSEDGQEGGFRHALSFARFLMAWHVVLDTYYMRGDGRQTSAMGRPWAVFARWGVISAPGFFIFSGFAHTYSKITMAAHDRNRDEDFFYGMTRRVAAWYPLYGITVTWCAVRLWSFEAEDWSQYMADMLLIRGWIWNRDSFPYVLGDWWLCYLMVYLLLFSPMYQVLSTSSNSVLWTLLTVASMVVIPFALLEWYCVENTPLVMLIQYWPSFILGQALAVWFVRNCMMQQAVASTATPTYLASCSPSSTRAPPMRRPGPGGNVMQSSRFGGFTGCRSSDRGAPELQHKRWEPGVVTYVMRPVHEIPAPCRFGVTLSLMVLGLAFFSFSPYDNVPLLNKPVLPLLLKGGLAPIQGLLVLGLACECDPMAKVFARKPFRFTERFAFTTFVFQVPIHNTILDFTGWDGLTRTFMISLLLFSVVTHYLIEKPWRHLLQLQEK